jgi:hypothetical protein
VISGGIPRLDGIIVHTLEGLELKRTDRIDLTPEAEQRITSVVRGLVHDKVERGIDLNRPMRCDSCNAEKSPYGSSQYGQYALCNDCLLEFTILLARGVIDSVDDYMISRPDESLRAENTSPLTNEPVAAPSLPRRREKFVPRSEPI